jgi:hypothetical protein
MDSRATLNDSDSFLPGTVNTLEPIQSYVSWRLDGALAEDSRSSVRVGRFTTDIGKRRLVARSTFRHAVATFAGAEWQWQSADGARAQAFYVVPMRIQPSTTAEMLDNDPELDRGARDTEFWGGYYLFAPLADRTQIDVTLLTLDSANGTGETVGPLDITTLALRVFRPVAKSGINYELEGGVQRGESAATTSPSGVFDHDAYYAHAEIGFSFDLRWSPNLLLQYDRASGDTDPTDSRNERFNPLFGERRFDFGPTGIYGPFARSNIDSPGVRLTLNPAPRWRTMLAYRSYRLAASRDAWVGSGLRDTTGQSGRSLGTQLEGSFNWTVLPNRLGVETGFALIDSGQFPRQAAGSAFRGSPRYFYAAVTTTF